MLSRGAAHCVLQFATMSTPLPRGLSLPWRAGCRLVPRPARSSFSSRGCRYVPIFLRVIRYWAIAGLIATAMALFTAFQTRLQFLLRGEEMSYSGTLLWSSVIWYIWALLAPFAILLTTRHPIEKGPALIKSVVLQIIFGAIFIGLHATIAALIMHDYPEQFGILPEVGPAQAEALAREELRTQAASAQLMALAQQMQPHFLFNALNALVAMQPE